MKTIKNSSMKVKFVIVSKLTVLMFIFIYCTAFDEGCGGVSPSPVPLFSITHSAINNGKVKFYYIPSETVFISEIICHTPENNYTDDIIFSYPYPVTLYGDKHIIKEYGNIVQNQSWDFELRGVNTSTNQYFNEHYFINVR